MKLSLVTYLEQLTSKARGTRWGTLDFAVHGAGEASRSVCVAEANTWDKGKQDSAAGLVRAMAKPASCSSGERDGTCSAT